VQDQYKLFAHVAFEIVRGYFEYPQDKSVSRITTPRLQLPADYDSSKKNYFIRYTKTLTLDEPPTEGFLEELTAFHPFFAKKYSMDPIGPKEASTTSTRGDTDEDDDNQEMMDGWASIPLDSLTINTTEDDFVYYKPIGKLVSPRHFSLVSTDDWANAWRTDFAVIGDNWTTLETIHMEDCLPIRPEQGDMGEGLAIPYQQCKKFKKATLAVRKWDGGPDPSQDLGESILGTIFWEVPSIEEWPEFTTFEIGVTGKARFKALEKQFEEFKIISKDFVDSGRWERSVRLSLLPGDVGPAPEVEDDSDLDSDEYEDYQREVEDEFYGDLDPDDYDYDDEDEDEYM
jgi:hypothetical protein